MPKVIGRTTYLTPPEAARQLGVSRATINRWLTTPDKLSVSVKVRRDPLSNRYYIAASSVTVLQKRFQLITN